MPVLAAVDSCFDLARPRQHGTFNAQAKRSHMTIPNDDKV